MFHNCTCIDDLMTKAVNRSAVLGQCPRKSDCDQKFKIYMAVSVVGSFFASLAATPGYMVLLRYDILTLSMCIMCIKMASC